MSMPSTSQETNGAHLKRKTTLLGLPLKRLSFERQVLRHFANQNRYLRVITKDLADIKAEQRDLWRLLLSKQSLGNIESNKNGLPLKTKCCGLSAGERLRPTAKGTDGPLLQKGDFQHFEEVLLKPDIRNNLVEILRSFFKKNVEDNVRRTWRKVISNELMQTYTRSGTPKPNSGKEKGLTVLRS
ncbi:hypothetical protein OUZ56_025306 [Daphnia magna]|uniref:DUF4806 domain-containing protein n=1 Tax=Daphnia magna TaxID=35525 RepID=A0ABQ9ZJG1_9CRUS|nr:hypothetical protein OUZ56_025306 [Daphnia magna]